MVVALDRPGKVQKQARALTIAALRPDTAGPPSGRGVRPYTSWDSFGGGLWGISHRPPPIYGLPNLWLAQPGILPRNGNVLVVAAKADVGAAAVTDFE